jgi:nucleotide-binding universal stress UspA family protein
VTEIRRILFATDFSAGSLRASLYAADLARRYGAKLFIVHVIQDVAKMTEWYAPRVSMAEVRRVMQEKAMKELDKSCADLLNGNKEVERRLLIGEPHEEIVRFQRENGIELTVIGTHGMGGGGKIIFGSTADRVVKNSGCPVLAVTPERVEEEKESTDAKICSGGTEIRF